VHEGETRVSSTPVTRAAAGYTAAEGVAIDPAILGA